MSEPFRILVVCLGNVCRSPLAERLLAARLGAPSPDFEVGSAGVQGLVGQPMDPDAGAQLVRLGGQPTGFTASRVSADRVRAADLVLTATQEIRGQVLQLVPPALRRTFTVLELAALLDDERVHRDGGGPAALVARASDWRSSAVDLAADGLDVADPIGRPADVHRAVADVLDRACETVASRLSSS